MKKKLLIGAMLMGAFFTANAQTTVWSDNFDDEDITDWTLTDADDDTFNWSVIQLTDNGGNPIGTPTLRSVSWVPDPAPNGTPLTPDNWAVSPAIDLSGYADGTTIDLNWKVMAVDPDFDMEEYTVYVGTSSDIASLEDSEVTFNETLGGVNDLEDRNLDISEFAGETVYVAFRHNGSVNEFTMDLDDVEVVASETGDVNDILASKFSVYPNPANNVINLTNAENILVSGVVITDLNGRTVKNVAFDGVASAQINVADLSAGMYMMTVSSDKGTMTKKIVKN